MVWSDLKDIWSNPCQGLTWLIHDLKGVKLEAGTSSHRAGGTSEGFLSAAVGSPTLSWVEGWPCRAVGCAQGFAELSCSEQLEGQRGAETFLNLPLSAFQSWAQPWGHCPLPLWLTQPGWARLAILESLSSKPSTANNAPVKWEIIPIHPEQDVEHLIITQLKHLLKIENNYLDNYSLEYPAIQSPGWYKNWCWPFAYEYNLELIVKCARPCKMGNSARIRSSHYLISRDHCCWQHE